MRPCIARCVYIVASIAFSSLAYGSPGNFKLLPLVPPKAAIVAGFQNLRTPNASGRLLLTTHNNRLDLDDWFALTGVDTSKAIDEVVEVASSGPDGALTEHMLLVAGHFDRGRIFRAAEQNGAEKAHYLGQTALVIQPFAREQGDMLDARWLAILNDQIGIFGTPSIVQEALRRYDDHSGPDPELAQRLAQLRPDVTTWNILASAPKPKGDIFFAQTHGAWIHLLEDADLLMVAARFAKKIRVDFVIDVKNERQSGYFVDKAGCFRDAFAPYPSVNEENAKPASPELQGLHIEQNRVQASVLLSRRQFDEWRDREISRNQAYLRAVLGSHGD